MLPGIAGIILPAFPGIPLMFVLALIFGLINNWQDFTLNNLLILAVITLVSLLVDYLSGVLGAKYGGANGKSILWGMLGLLMGIIALPPLGGIFGLFLGVLISEIVLHGNKRQAVMAASSSLLGSVLGIVINGMLAIVFLVLFIIYAL